MNPRTLLVTVDSLRYDHFEYMPETRAFLEKTYGSAFATSTFTGGSFPSIIKGEYAKGNNFGNGTSVAVHAPAASVGITTNHLLSPRYGYDEGFDYFVSPASESNSIKNRIAPHLTIGSPVYKLASWTWGNIQRIKSILQEVDKSFRHADDVIDEFLHETAEIDEWFGWLHFMEPHYPYDPDTAGINRAEAQALSRKVIADGGTEEEQDLIRQLYRSEVENLDAVLARLWNNVPNDTRVVFCADHGELLGEDGLWGHPGETRTELLRVPFGTRNAPELGDVVSLIDIPTILRGEAHGEGTLDRDIAFAAYGTEKAAMNERYIATPTGVRTLGGEDADDSELEAALTRFEPATIVKEDALLEDLEKLGYV